MARNEDEQASRPKSKVVHFRADAALVEGLERLAERMREKTSVAIRLTLSEKLRSLGLLP